MNISFEQCHEDLNKMNDLQLFLLSKACPEELKITLLEQQLDLIGNIDMKISLLEDKLSNESTRSHCTAENEVATA